MKTSNISSQPDLSPGLSPSFLLKVSSTLKKQNSSSSKIGTFGDFDLIATRETSTASTKQPTYFKSALRQERNISSASPSPDKLFSLKEKISSIGSGNGAVKQANIYLQSGNKDTKPNSYHSKQHFMPEKMNQDVLTQIRLQLESCNHEQVANLSSHYINELMAVQQSIFRNLRMIPSFKGRV